MHAIFHSQEYSQEYRVLVIVAIFLLLVFQQSLNIYAQRLNSASFYVEQSEVLAESTVHFPRAVHFNDSIFVVYQRIISNGAASSSGNGSATSQSIVYRQSTNGRNWSSEEVLIEEIPLENELSVIPQIFSLAANKEELAVAVSVSSTSTQVLTRRANSLNWEREEINTAEEEFLDPRIFARETGFVLFGLQRTRQDSVLEGIERAGRRIVFTQRANGGGFSETARIPVPNDQIEVINPHILESNNQLYLVYESISFTMDLGITHQIFLSRSSNNAQTWSAPVHVSNFVDTNHRADAGISPENYINKNPHLYRAASGEIVLIFDRNRQGQVARVSLSRLSDSGEIINVRNQRNVYISAETRSASFSEFFVHDGINYVLYDYNVLGSSRIFLASEGVLSWNSEDISPRDSANAGGYNFLVRAVQHNARVSFFWLQRASVDGVSNRLLYRSADQLVMEPVLSPLSFVLGQASNFENVTVAIDYPPDSSGIATLRYAWTQASNPTRIEFTEQSLSEGEEGNLPRVLNLLASRHGTWRLFAQLRDRAGNMSRFAVLTYELDSIAPSPVRFSDISEDQNGYLASNTTTIAWQSTEEELRYRRELRYLSSANSPFAREIYARDRAREELVLQLQNSNFTQSSSTTNSLFLELQNAENGLWALIVAAVDRSGNEGEKSVRLLRLNKFIPFTALYLVDLDRQISGEYIFRFNGRGFTANGTVSSIIFDQNGQEPWDYELRAASNSYTIDSDRVISNIRLQNFVSGDYSIILNHSTRGLYFHNEILSLERGAAVKIGDYSLYEPEVNAVLADRLLRLPIQDIIIILLSILVVLVLLISLNRIRSILKDTKGLEGEITALVEGRLSPASIDRLEEKLRIVQKQGIGLRIKFTALMLILVIGVVSVISLPLSNFILRNQEQTLVQGLEERIAVMIESLASGAVNSLQEGNIVERIQGLGELNEQTRVMDEIEYFTVTAFPNPSEPNLDQSIREYVWFTSDPLLSNDIEQRTGYIEDIASEFQRAEYFERNLEERAEEGFRPGVFRIQDGISEYLQNEVIPQFNANSEDPAILGIVENLNTLLERRSSGATSDLGASLEQEAILRTRLEGEIDKYVSIRSIPQLSVENYDTSSQYYTVFYPLYWVDSKLEAEYQGSIRFGISTEDINAQIRDTRRRILVQVLIFTAIAIVAGLAGALILASITINPIKKLVTGVERIRDTEVMSELRDSPIVVQTRDELHYLSDTINQMTLGLIRAEQANKSLLLGKDLQKMFIALDKNPHDERTKATTRHEETNRAEFFGYYEGAKGVSGDYYYYLPLGQDAENSSQYAIIKCDVSGKDIEAALIMVTVATLFLQHFKQVQKSKVEGIQSANSKHQLSELIKNINSIIFERDFKGKFAALSILIVDSETGDVEFCNAGDNVVHIYRRSEEEVEALEFAHTPAAGAIDESVIGVPINYPVEHFTLAFGDILLLFTDGFEESRRYIRHPSWEIYKAEEFQGEAGAEALRQMEEEIAPYIITQDEDGISESFSIARIHAVVEAATKRQIYQLKKYRNPNASEKLEFDFRTMAYTLPNIVLALMSVEKVFRLVPGPSLTREDSISIDKKIDNFLKTHFLQYGEYFQNPLRAKNTSLYNTYCFMSEDSQYDDLTILAMERK